MNWSRIIPGTAVGIGALYLLMAATSGAPSGKMDLAAAARIPVVAEGRVKPLDTVARTSLMLISSRQTFKDKEGETRPAIQFLLETMLSNPRSRTPTVAWEYKVFRIENDQVRNLLNLENRPGSLRYSLVEIQPRWEELHREAVRVDNINEKERSVYEQKVFELRQHIEVFLKLAQGREPRIVPSASSEEDWFTYEHFWDAAEREALAQVDPKQFDEAARRLQEYAARNQLDLNALSEQARQDLLDRLLRHEIQPQTQEILARRYPAAEAWSRMLTAYQANKPEEFNQAVADFRKAQGTLPAGAEQRARFEVFFNNFAPFYQCMVLYVLVFVLACSAFLAYPEVLNRAAFWLAGLTLVVHSLALLVRMYLQGRPPVTNLYSSAVFIGWGCVCLGLFLEWIFRNGIGNVVAAVTGFATTLVAHHLAESSGDTLEMMRAVLDTNFWLATHVTCITLGYSATFFAGFLGILFVVLGLFTPRLDREMFRSLSQMIYGVVCFATLLSFVGTVLGGIWADQSWGRFWGWDPKENGALLIVLMNALILHARWGGLVKQRGMAVLAIAGNMVVGWSWFGTNQLGVGLHAYGFNNTLATGLSIFWATQIACIACGLIPTRYWASFGKASPPAENLPVLKRVRRQGNPGIQPG
jgi:ABC-type transport system involved in cytochrome c biogenesis permease subunit